MAFYFTKYTDIHKFLLLILIVGSLPLLLESPETIAADCSNAPTTIEQNDCAAEKFRQVDRRLNRVYKRVLAKIATEDTRPPFGRKAWKRALIKAQKAWIAFRDADCRKLVEMEWQGGTGTTGAIYACMTDKTLTRIRELKERYLNY